MKIGFLGAGAMGGAILSGAMNAGVLDPKQVYISDMSDKIKEKYAALGCNIVNDNEELGRAADIVVLAVKPQYAAPALAGFGSTMDGKAVISIMAGVTVVRLRKMIAGNIRVLRTMPNTPALVNAGAFALCSETDLTAEERLLRAIFGEKAREVRDTSLKVPHGESGIVLDTKNFTMRTGGRTFEAAAYLRRSGADITRVRKLFRDDMAEYKVKAKAVDKAEVFEGAFAISECQGEGIENPTIIAAQTANELLGIKGIKASVVLTEYQGVIYLSARSIDEVNVQIIMERMGGGGHMNTAACQMEGVGLVEAIGVLKNTIDDMLESGEI